MNRILDVNNISKSFHTLQGEVKTIDNVSLTVDKSEFVAIVGTSGCGKSTLLSIIAGLIEQSSGEIKFTMDKPIIGYMLQEDALFSHMTVLENVLLGLKILKIDNDENISYAKNLIKKYDLENFMNKYPRELSGGMKQRVA